MKRRSGMLCSVFILGFLLLLPEARAGKAGFEYDEAGRLIRVEYDEGTVIEYGYDKMGNKLSETVAVLPVVTVIATGAEASEAGRDVGRFRISRSGSKELSLAVRYTLKGDAVNGEDYEKLPGEAAIPAGKSSVDVVVNPVDDGKKEGAEAVKLTISESGAYTIGTPGGATVSIKDND